MSCCPARPNSRTATPTNEAPGLGIDIDEERARKYPMEPPSGREDGFTVRSIDGTLVRP